MGKGGPFDNAVDTGGMVKCCTKRGKGSHGEDPKKAIACFLEVIAQAGKGRQGDRPRRPQEKEPGIDCV